MVRADWESLKKYGAEDAGLVVRRFMSLRKLDHLVTSRSLYFAPASHFRDKLEGHYTFQDYADWAKQLSSWDFPAAARCTAYDAKAAAARSNAAAVVISCWTTAPADHKRMWEEYAGSPKAVVVESTVGRLRSELGDEFLIIPVRYFDPNRERLPKDHSLQPFFYKQAKNYKWEQEVRLIGEMQHGVRIGSPRKVAVNVGKVVSAIRTHPDAPEIFREQVRSLVRGVCQVS